MRVTIALLLVGLSLSPATAADSWNGTKNEADDIAHAGETRDFYCGCGYRSDGDSDGSGDITRITECGYVAPDKHKNRASRIEWEHVVPASLMPARQFDCWLPPGGSRQRCEAEDPKARAMIFDLHNLVPAIGQVNALRDNDRYGELPEDASDFGACPIEDGDGVFEPADCKKGDVARIWLYMEKQHGVEIPAAERRMFLRWSRADPVSPWEKARERRIAAYTGVVNPFVHTARARRAGSCAWE